MSLFWKAAKVVLVSMYTPVNFCKLRRPEPLVLVVGDQLDGLARLQLGQLERPGRQAGLDLAVVQRAVLRHLSLGEQETELHHRGEGRPGHLGGELQGVVVHRLDAELGHGFLAGNDLIPVLQHAGVEPGEIPRVLRIGKILIGGDPVVSRHGCSIRPLQALLDVEGPGQAIRRDFPLLGRVGDDVEVLVQVDQLILEQI